MELNYSYSYSSSSTLKGFGPVRVQLYSVRYTLLLPQNARHVHTLTSKGFRERNYLIKEVTKQHQQIGILYSRLFPPEMNSTKMDNLLSTTMRQIEFLY